MGDMDRYTVSWVYENESEEYEEYLAKDMSLESAMIFVDALFSKYFNEEKMTIKISRQKNKENKIWT